MNNKVCCLFGHRDCFALEESRLQAVLEEQIISGTYIFYVGNQGNFDAVARSVLKKLQQQYPKIQYSVVLAYLPKKRDRYDDYSDTIYPDGMENTPYKFAISKRNRWMVEQSDACVCYINRTWGGAYNVVKYAQKKNLKVINLGTVLF